MTDGGRIRICYVLNSFCIGGAETVVLDLARRHDPQVFDVEVLAALEPKNDDEPEMHRRFREAGVKTAMIHQENFRSPWALWRLFSYLKEGNFDIVHGHNRGSDYWAAKLGTLAGIPHVFWTRHLVYRDMTPKQINRYRNMSGRAFKVLAVSEAVRKACTEIEAIPAERVQTVVNGIDMEKYRPLEAEHRQRVRESLSVASTEHLLLFVGRFSDQKAPEMFPELIWALRLRGLPVRGFMCGYGPNAAALGRQVADGPEGVRILGLRSDIPDLLGAADLFVSTSRNEGLPLNVMEAMAAGTEFVAPGIPQVRELVVGETSFDNQLFDPPPLAGPVPAELVSAWADKVASILGTSGTLGKGLRGREIISRDFSLTKMVNSYEKLFQRACGRTLDC